MGLIVATANFYLTNAGKAAALDAANNSINIEVTRIALGTAKYDAQVTAPTQTALTTEVGRYNLVGGGSSGQVLRLTTTLTPNYTAEIFEIGLFLSDGTLFAVAAVTGTDPLMQTANGLTSVITLGCSLAEVGSNVTVSVDANSPISVVLMNQHLDHPDPHPQYLLKTDFNTVVIALQHADSALQQNINTEEANRISADNLLNNKIDLEIINRINALNNIVDLFYPVGIIVAFGIPNFNPNDKWAGTTWVRHGEGRASVGVSTQIADPAWTKVVGNTFGAYTHQLTIDEMPRHRHSLGDAAGTSGAGRTPDLNNSPPENLNDTDSVGYAGGDQPHNNVQPSIVDARWRRVA